MYTWWRIATTVSVEFCLLFCATPTLFGFKFTGYGYLDSRQAQRQRAARDNSEAVIRNNPKYATLSEFQPYFRIPPLSRNIAHWAIPIDNK